MCARSITKRKWNLFIASIALIALTSYTTFYLAFSSDIKRDNDTFIQTLNYDIDTNDNEINNDNQLTKELHTISYFTFPKPGQRNMELFCKCININTQLNINTTYLGYGNTFDFQNKNKRTKKALKHSGKLFAVSEYLTHLSQLYTIQQQKHSIIILFIDGYDVIFQRNYSYILNQFININKQSPYKNKVIWSVDNNCWPYGDWCDKFINMSSNKNDILFLNAGGWIGYLYDVNLMFDKFRDTANQFNNDLNAIQDEFWSDQGFYSHHYFQNNSNMILDYNSQMFQKFLKIEYENEELIMLKENGWYNTKTNNYPSILHFAGQKGKYHFHEHSKKLVNLFVDKNIMDHKVSGSMDVTFARNDGTTVTLKYNQKQMCRKLKHLYY